MFSARTVFLARTKIEKNCRSAVICDCRISARICALKTEFIGPKTGKNRQGKRNRATEEDKLCDRGKQTVRPRKTTLRPASPDAADGARSPETVPSALLWSNLPLRPVSFDVRPPNSRLQPWCTFAGPPEQRRSKVRKLTILYFKARATVCAPGDRPMLGSIPVLFLPERLRSAVSRCLSARYILLSRLHFLAAPHARSALSSPLGPEPEGGPNAHFQRAQLRPNSTVAGTQASSLGRLAPCARQMHSH